jgi:eukaryotic translation initiation factor 2C
MSITAKPANEIEFTMADRDGTGEVRTNLAAYYKNAYGKDLRYPRLPYVARACPIGIRSLIASSHRCVVYGKRNYVPMEFVDLEPFNSLPPNKLTSDQVRAPTSRDVKRTSADRHAIAICRPLT